MPLVRRRTTAYGQTHWTEDDDALVDEKRLAGWTREQIAAYIGRTTGSVDWRIGMMNKARGVPTRKLGRPYYPPVLDHDCVPRVPDGDPLLCLLRRAHGRDAPRDVREASRTPINATGAGVVHGPLCSSALGDL